MITITLLVVFASLKLSAAIDWPWLYVLSPLILNIALQLFIVFLQTPVKKERRK